MLDFYIKKANGEKEVFYYKKLEDSLRNIGTTEELIKEIITEISSYAYDGISTEQIYKKAFSILKKREKAVAVRYSLKRSVAMLGPTGFPFEKYIAEIFKTQGYETLNGVIVQGKCAQHEIDVVAWKGDKLIMVEAKFHTNFGAKSDLKVVLYVKARYDDILGMSFNFGGKRILSEGWLITNTKFSSTAIEYGECQRLNMVGWNYPFNNNLHYMIEKEELIPLTALTSLTTSEKNKLLNQGIVLSKDLLDEKILRDLMFFDDLRITKIKEEVLILCEHCKTNFK